MPYSTVLFDLDHTLLDSNTSEAEAFHYTLVSHGIDSPRRYFDAYARINRALWAAVERGEITPDEVRVARFATFVEELGLAADPARMAEAFVTGLGDFGELYDGAIPVLEAAGESARLVLVTNGLSDVQRARIRRLDIERYFAAIVISAEVGVAKPAAGIFDFAFEALSWPDRATALIVGDSISSDIEGGANYGIDTCWYNPQLGQRPAEPAITHEISNLGELPAIVSGATVT